MFDFNKFPRIDHLNVKALDKASKAVLKAYNSDAVGPLFHNLLIAEVKHAIHHKSGNRLTKLWNDLPPTVNAYGVLTWITTFTSLVYSDKKGFIGKRDEETKDRLWTFLIEGEATPFYAMPKVKNQKNNLVWSFFAAIDRTIAKGKKEIEAGKVTDAVEAELIRMLANTMPELRELAVANVNKAKEAAKVAKDAAKVEKKIKAIAA